MDVAAEIADQVGAVIHIMITMNMNTMITTIMMNMTVTTHPEGLVAEVVEVEAVAVVVVVVGVAGVVEAHHAVIHL